MNKGANSALIYCEAFIVLYFCLKLGNKYVLYAHIFAWGLLQQQIQYAIVLYRIQNQKVYIYMDSNIPLKLLKS